MHDDADGEAQEFVDGAHPGGVALGEVVVNGYHMHAAAGQPLEVDGSVATRVLPSPSSSRRRGLMQHHAAHELHVEMALADGALGGFAHRREGLRNQIFERSSVLDARAEVVGAARKAPSDSAATSGSSLLMAATKRRVFLQLAVVGRAEHLAAKVPKGKHWTLALSSQELVQRCLALGRNT